MNVGVASSNTNPNTNYFNSRGMWVTYILVVIFGHYVLLSIPTISVAMAWTATHVTHNVVSLFTYIVLIVHYLNFIEMFFIWQSVKFYVILLQSTYMTNGNGMISTVLFLIDSICRSCS